MFWGVHNNVDFVSYSQIDAYTVYVLLCCPPVFNCLEMWLSFYLLLVLPDVYPIRWWHFPPWGLIKYVVLNPITTFIYRNVLNCSAKLPLVSHTNEMWFSVCSYSLEYTTSMVFSDTSAECRDVPSCICALKFVFWGPLTSATLGTLDLWLAYQRPKGSCVTETSASLGPSETTFPFTVYNSQNTNVSLEGSRWSVSFSSQHREREWDNSPQLIHCTLKTHYS